MRIKSRIDNNMGEMGGLIPLWFDGAVCDFKEMPKVDDKTAIASIYNTCKVLAATGNYPVTKSTVPVLLLNICNSIKHIINFNKF